MTDPKLTELRAKMAARSDVDPYAKIRKPLLALTEEELFARRSPFRVAIRAAMVARWGAHPDRADEPALGAQKALAELVAEAWGNAEHARQDINRYLHGRNLRGDRIEAITVALGLTLR